MTVAINLDDLLDLADQSRDVFDPVALLFGDALMDAPLVEIAPSRDEYGIVPTWNVPREVLRGAKIEDLEKLLAGT
jgi:hypothetical protein